MRCLIPASTEPYFNLATEEYLLKQEDDWCMLWQSTPSVIVGKHQNAIAEINPEILENKKIHVARRLSGGGAVYHDLGNLNFSFIKTGRKGQQVNFKKYTAPILGALKAIGLDAAYGTRNDLRVGTLKISGNAEHVFRERVLHHGTLLFDTNLDELNRVLRVDPFRFEDKGVRSARSRVGNIRDMLSSDMDIQGFRTHIIEYLIRYSSVTMTEINRDELEKVEKIAREKYRRWEWNFGYSPAFSGSGKFNHNDRTLHVNYRVEKGLLTQVKLSPGPQEDRWKMIMDNVTGTKHRFQDIASVILKTVGETDLELDVEKVARAFF
jgi:lipoate-protein ligase A